MKLLNLGLTLGLLAAPLMYAQGPMYDKITVKLPYAVTVNDTVLQPGEYEIRQHESAAGGSRIVHFYSDKGMKFETTAMGIAALENKTPSDTTLVLDHYGSDYYLNKIWVQGKNYGYEFPIPESVRLREKERSESATLPAHYEQSSTVAQNEAPPPAAEATTPPPPPAVVETQPAAPVEAQPAPAQQAETQPATEPATAPVETAQNQTPPPPEAAAPPPQEMADRGPTMPQTSAGWLSMLLAGGLMTGAGFTLRRYRA